jgi:hypothetical protein
LEAQILELKVQYLVQEKSIISQLQEISLNMNQANHNLPDLVS